MLTATVLSAAIPNASNYEYSSPRNPCRVRRGGGYRNDPYRALVFAPSYLIETPTTRHRREAAAAIAAMEAASMMVAAQQIVTVAAVNEPATVAASAETSFANTSMAQSEASGRSPSPVPSTVSSTTAATSTSTMPPGERCVVVEFKHETCMYRAPFRVSIGDVVAVEADRGENIGRVVEICNQAPNYEVPNRVLRRASQQDISAVEALRANEVQVTTNVQRVAESVGLGIRVVDTEFQTDMNKLTIYYSARAPIDFRKLQRTLFRDYRCRIWIVNWSEVEFRKKQADRCLGVSICSKLGSRLNAQPKVQQRSEAAPHHTNQQRHQEQPQQQSVQRNRNSNSNKVRTA